MKKLALFTIVFVLLFCCCATAEESEIITVEPAMLPETYVKPQAKLLSRAKTIDETLIEGWESLSESIDIENYRIPVSEFASIYRGILRSNPRIYFVSTGFSYSHTGTGGYITKVYPDYIETDKAVISATLEAIDDATDEILISIDDGMTDFEKIMTVHNHMVFDYEYDYSYSMYDLRIMVTKTGVCQAYAMAFMHLMNELEIDCTFVSSTAMNHSWNLVKLDGDWYHIDLTWDDATGLPYAACRNTFSLLSDYKIQNMTDSNDNHYGYDSKGISASSTKYDNATWHEDYSAVVTVDDLYYWEENGNIVRSDGSVIYRDLDGGDGWWNVSAASGFPGSYYSSLAERNGILYFNTDTEIISYNPKNKKLSTILSGYGICRIYIFENTLHYGVYSLSTGTFTEGGSVNLGKIRYGKPRHEKGKIVTRVYKETDEPIFIYSSGAKKTQVKKISKKGISSISFDPQNNQNVFYWNEFMQPLKEKEVVDN